MRPNRTKKVEGLRRRPGIAVLACLLWAALAARPTPLCAIEHDKPGCPPYALTGNRIVFTNWFYVRPGQPDYLDKSGASVYAKKMKYDPLELRYVYNDRPHGIRIVAEPARRVGPIFPQDRPWESRGISPDTLMYDDGKYRLWGAAQDTDNNHYPCYFESEDGLTWRKPSLGLIDFNGNRDNNLITSGGSSVFKDPSAPPAERYKSVWHGSCDLQTFEKYRKERAWSTIATEMDPHKVHAIKAAVSPDGFRWTELPDPLGFEPTDTQVVGYYDERLAKYVLYTRSYMLGVRAPGFDPPPPEMYQLYSRRAIGRTESKDFRRFAPAEVIAEPGPDMLPTDQIYTNCRTTIPGAPDHHLMFPTIFDLNSDTTSVEFRSSYDGKAWHRVPGGPVLGTATYGQWDGGCVFACPNLVERSDGSWVLPYAGYANPHKYPHGAGSFGVGLAVWPKGRLVALAADDEGGFTTVPVIAPGRKLRINAVTERAGCVMVEAADLAGKPIAGRTFDDAVPIVGDRHWAPVTWKHHADLGIEPNTPVVLRFRLKMARIYGLEFE
ncbi:MAG TPA: hypothetical protein VLM89_04380 [Phycisphaerae bacterium]|nr:hypothetical protein [Phycisphaerae bacterium]